MNMVVSADQQEARNALVALPALIERCTVIEAQHLNSLQTTLLTLRNEFSSDKFDNRRQACLFAISQRQTLSLTGLFDQQVSLGAKMSLLKIVCQGGSPTLARGYLQSLLALLQIQSNWRMLEQSVQLERAVIDCMTLLYFLAPVRGYSEFISAVAKQQSSTEQVERASAVISQMSTREIM